MTKIFQYILLVALSTTVFSCCFHNDLISKIVFKLEKYEVAAGDMVVVDTDTYPVFDTENPTLSFWVNEDDKPYEFKELGINDSDFIGAYKQEKQIVAIGEGVKEVKIPVHKKYAENKAAFIVPENVLPTTLYLNFCVYQKDCCTGKDTEPLYADGESDNPIQIIGDKTKKKKKNEFVSLRINRSLL